MFYNLLLDKDVPVTVTFTDVPDSAWYADAVNTLASLGMINGVGDNKFEPERSITRAEFTAIAMRFARMPTPGIISSATYRREPGIMSTWRVPQSTGGSTVTLTAALVPMTT